eukprot:CAMPEP_0170178680 /NCGR_PEP_ID=MMETSP0040_2-20121228/13498_1 /TAXON_ID=641309 /ORGANISM="Lotharella oceanica, Strain CCMP622" /LENGTH=233 /DNA_ID=CAMNT_0010422053 /DNA_START=29 /DNA_END=730 /DNA_ORIENTATION=+
MSSEPICWGCKARNIYFKAKYPNATLKPTDHSARECCYLNQRQSNVARMDRFMRRLAGDYQGQRRVIASKVEEIRMLRRRLNAKDAKIGSLKKEKHQMKADMDALMMQLNAKDTPIGSLKEKIHQVEAVLQKMEQEKNGLDAELEEKSALLRSDQEHVRASESELKASLEINEDLKEKLDCATMQCAKLSKEDKTLREKIQALVKEHRNVGDRLSRLASYNDAPAGSKRSRHE